MTCPRCGVMNPADRSTCSRCSGSLARPPVRDEAPLPPVLPITRRAELTMGRSGAASPPGGPGAAGRLSGTAHSGGGPQGATPPGAELGTGELYLLAAERSTGQPPPPEAPPGPAEPARAERPARVAIGLTGA